MSQTSEKSHRIVWLGRDLHGIVPIPSHSKGPFHLDLFAPSPTQPGTEHLKSSKKHLKNFFKVQGPDVCQRAQLSFQTSTEHILSTVTLQEQSCF